MDKQSGAADQAPTEPYAACGCGSRRAHKDCCGKVKPQALLREALASYYWVLRAQVVDAQTSGRPAEEVQRLQEKRDLCATLKRSPVVPSQHDGEPSLTILQELREHIGEVKSFSGSGDWRRDQHVRWAFEGLERWIDSKLQGPAATGSPKAKRPQAAADTGSQQEKEGAVTGAAQGQETRAPAEATLMPALRTTRTPTSRSNLVDL